MKPTIVHVGAAAGTVAEFDVLTLQCQFEDPSVTSFAWLRQMGQEIQTINFLIMNGRAAVNTLIDNSSCPPVVNTLQLYNVTELDDATYICVPTSADFSSKSAHIAINIIRESAKCKTISYESKYNIITSDLTGI